MKKKTLLMITWRDIRSPFAGGAEVLSHGILKKISRKYNITVLTSAFPNCKQKETIDGIKYIRLGSKRFNFIGVYNWRVYFSVFRYWWNNIRNKKKFDVVIEQINNIPFLYPLYANKNTIIYINQLCRVNWFFQTPFPISIIGYFIFEPIYLWLLRKQKVITISESTKKDLLHYGFQKNNIKVIRVGIELSPLKKLKSVKKFDKFSVLSLGNIRNMKRTLDQLCAFEQAKKKIPELQLFISGTPGGAYAGNVFDMINRSIYKKDIIYLGHISKYQKKEYMQKCHCVLVTSTKEGWGLVVTEAGSQGTPAIVYDIDGLRDAVKYGQSGYLCKKNTPESLAKGIIKLFENKSIYKKLQKKAWEMSKNYNFKNSYKDFLNIINEFV